jgi:5-methylcytosine-specific restriction enzyme subunit McrC
LKNLQVGEKRQLEGILLYPTVGKSLDLQYRIQGHSIRVVTVDLDSDWREIHERLIGLLVLAS